MSFDRLRRAYGARLAHLAGMLAVLGIAAYAIAQVAGRPDFRQMAIWFLGAVILHDIVFLPAYSVANRAATAAGPLRRGTGRALAVINHLRAPIALAGLLFLLFYPSILQKAEPGFLSNADYGTDPFPDRWLWTSMVLVVGSLALLAVSLVRHRRRRASAPRDGESGSS